MSWCVHILFIIFLLKVVGLLIFICCYQGVLVNKDIQCNWTQARLSLSFLLVAAVATLHWLREAPPPTIHVAADAPPKTHNLIHHRHQRKPTTRYTISDHVGQCELAIMQLFSAANATVLAVTVGWTQIAQRRVVSFRAAAIRECSYYSPHVISSRFSAAILSKEYITRTTISK